METEGFFPLEIIINVLVSFFRFIWIPMLWVYDQYKCGYTFSVGTVFLRQNLTSIDVRFWRKKMVFTRQMFFFFRRRMLRRQNYASLAVGSPVWKGSL